MSNIQNLIATGRTSEAIQMLIDSRDNETSNQGTLLMGRLTRAKREQMLGTVSSADHILDMNRINQAVLSFCGSNSTHRSSAPHQSPAPQRDINEARLLEIITANKRRRPQIAEEAQSILNECRAWNDEKTKTASFDPVNRRLKAIQVKADALINSLAEEMEASLESIIERIAKLLEKPVPEYSELKEAFVLACGRGLKSSWIEQQLDLQPNDDEVRISIAEKIEEFTLSIRIK